MKIDNFKIIVQARTNSSRFPKKIIRDIENNVNFLQVLLLRLLSLKDYAEVIIATTDQKDDDIIEKIANDLSLAVFRGSENNVLERFIQCSEKHNASHIIRVCSDNPFIDLDSIKNLIKQYNGEDYLSYSINGNASILSHCGFFTELVSLSALKKVYKSANNSCIEHVTNCIYQNPDRYNIRLLPIVLPLDNIRCTLDTKSDFEILKTIYFDWYKDKKLEKQNFNNLTHFLESRPELLLKMKNIIKQNIK